MKMFAVCNSGYNSMNFNEFIRYKSKAKQMLSANVFEKNDSQIHEISMDIDRS